MRIEDLTLELKREAASLDNHVQRNRATSLTYALQGHIEHAVLKILELPAIDATVCDDGSYMIEWIFENKRLGFSIEAPPKMMESGWFLVAKDGTAESGLLSEGGMDKLVERFLRLDGAPTGRWKEVFGEGTKSDDGESQA